VRITGALVAAALALAGVLPAGATASVRAHAARIGPAPGAQRLQLALPLRADDAGLQAFASAVSTPGSALYGADAFNGVINIITYDPIHDNINVASLRAGTQHNFSGSVVGTSQSLM